jgi:NADPH-dependent ferric siderophore reductase
MVVHGDETALPGMSIMAESLPAGVPGVMVVELPEHVSGHDPQLSAEQTWTSDGSSAAPPSQERRPAW